MIVVIIAGGSGTRLWPLSTPEFPKQLLKVNSSQRSLLQNTYDRAQRLTETTKIYVVTEGSHADHVRAQLADLPANNFIVEPGRRGTANCIVATLAHLQSRQPADEPIAFLSADHFIRDAKGFAQSFQLAAESSLRHRKIVLVGVEPDHPAIGFGYIKKGDLVEGERFVYNVGNFKEKPSLEVAHEYVKSGDYLWNCGYFVGSIEVFTEAMSQFAPNLLATYKQLLAAGDNYKSVYLSLESIAIDYALIEHVQNLLVVPAAFDWMDLGSFGDLHKATSFGAAGNYVAGNVELDGVENSYIDNQDSKPLAVIGLDNVVIVNTPAGILVARKDLTQQVGDIAKRIAAKSTSQAEIN